MNGLCVTNVTKCFGDVRALSNVTVEFQPNTIYGLLGRNGAGKTTLLNVITNRIFPDEGKVTLNGEEVAENDKMLRNIFMMSEKSTYPENMRVSEAFRWTKEFYPSFDEDKAMALAERFRLNVKKKIKALSTGYSSIFKLIMALCVNVPYVFLDEPVLGLDANHRDLFYKMLLESYAEQPATYVISTHLIEEISGIIEDVVIIRDGEVIRKETREELLSHYFCVTGSVSAVDRFIADKKVVGLDALGGLKTAYLEGTPVKGAIPDDVEVTKMDLQRLFIQLTNSKGERS